MYDAGSSEVAEQLSAAPWPVAASFDFTRSPRPLASHDAAELHSEAKHNFFRRAEWCFDGSAILVTSEDRVLRIWDTPTEGDARLANHRTFSQPDSIVSTAWYPTASLNSPETFCFVASIRDGPVRMIDATDGRIRATYPIIDHRERFIAPHSLSFSPDATNLYCGFESAVEVLDVLNPGATGERRKTTPTKREKSGQSGIISALTFAPDYSGLFMAGSFSQSVSVYTEHAAMPVQHLDGVEGGGVTQIRFHPLNPQIVFIASRRSTCIQIFDLRDPSAPYGQFRRRATTNQRLWFDVDPWGRWLASGDEHGVVRVWDISTLSSFEPIFEERLHRDAVGSVQFHPYKPLLLTASGSRATTSPDDQGDDDSTDSDSDGSSDEDEEKLSPPSKKAKQEAPDTNITIWSFAHHT